MLTLNGVVETIIFRNETNGYTVAKVATEDDLITIVGNTPFLKVGDKVEAEGELVYHKKYSEQFAFQKLNIQLPQKSEDIIKYLSAGTIPYVGKKTAEDIVDRFGEKTLDIMHNHPERLKEIPGIGDVKVQKISEAYEEQRDLQNLLAFTTDFGFSVALNMRIYSQYGNDAVEIIKENPYKLATDIRGIGFKRADEVATIMGFDKNSDARKIAGIHYAMTDSLSQGHCYLPKEELLYRSSRLLNIPKEELEGFFLQLSLDSRFFVQRKDNSINVYFTHLFKAENTVAGKLLELMEFEHDDDFDVDSEMDSIESRLDIKFDSSQRLAICESVNNGLLVITGGPGTGKTTTLKAIIEVFEAMNLKVALAAPTGRAAKRMTQATTRDAVTIHRLLDFAYADEVSQFNFNEENPLEIDVLIIDEMSMVDIQLMSSLLVALKKDTRLILVGDPSQLPSVGAGNVLDDIIKSEQIKVVNLGKIFRQAEESMIIKNAHLINRGSEPEFTGVKRDFFIINSPNMKNSVELIADLVQRRLPEYYNVDPLRDIQVLAPMRKGEAGVNNLNNILQLKLNPKDREKKEVTYNNIVFRENDRVMQIKNNYQIDWTSESDVYEMSGQGVFNGDMGFIEEIDPDEKTVKVRIDDYKLIEYVYRDLDELQLCYATTIHKSQGSEFPAVIIPLHWAPDMLLTRNLIYTAITRASKLVVLVGQYKYLKYMIDNDKVADRHTNLSDKLVEVSSRGMSV